MRQALEGLRGVQEATVDLETGVVTVRTEAGVVAEATITATAVEGKVILSWARGLLARVPFLGRRQP